MSKQSIKIVLAGNSYPFTIESGSEEVYRLAEREVNKYVAGFQKHNVKNFTERDYLAMTALKLAIVNINAMREGELSREDIKELGPLKDRIEEYLNSLESEK